MQFSRLDRLGELRLVDLGVEGDVFAERQVEQLGVLEDEGDLGIEAVARIGVDRPSVVEHLARGRRQQARHHKEQLRLAGRRRSDDSGACARRDVERHPLQHLAVAIGQDEILDLQGAGQGQGRFAARGRRRGVQHCAEAHVRGLGLTDRHGGEADDDDREDKDGEIGQEGRQLADGHPARDHKMAAQAQDDQGGHIGQEGDHRDHRGELAQDLHADGARGLRRLGKAGRLARLGVDEADQGGADDGLGQHPVHHVDDALDLAEQLAHPAHEHEEARPDQGQHQKHRHGQLPVQPDQKAAGGDNDEDRGDQGRRGLGDEGLDGVDIGGEVGQELRRRHRLDRGVGLRRDHLGKACTQVPRHPFGGDGLHHVLQVAEQEGPQRQGGQGDQRGGQVEVARVEGVDRVGDDLRHGQVQRIARRGQPYQQRHLALVGPEQRPEAGHARLWRPFRLVDHCHLTLEPARSGPRG